MAWRVFGILFGADGNPAPDMPILARPAEGRARGWVSGVRAAGDVRARSAPTGYFSISLTPGKHYFWIGASRRIAVVVPQDAGEYFLPDLLGIPGAMPTLGGNYRITAGSRQLVSANDGTFWTLAIVGPPEARRLGFSATVPTNPDAPNFRYRDGMLELADFGNNTWHAPYLSNGSLFVAVADATPQPVDRIAGGLWQLKDVVTGRFRTWFISGTPGHETLGFGPELV